MAPTAIPLMAPASFPPKVTLSRRHKPGYKRSRAGCLTCRKRKVKCDEDSPVCKNCTRLRRTCHWNAESRAATLILTDGTTDRCDTSLSQPAGGTGVHMGGDQVDGHGDWPAVQDTRIINDVVSALPLIDDRSFGLENTGWGSLLQIQPQQTSGGIPDLPLSTSPDVLSGTLSEHLSGDDGDIDGFLEWVMHGGSVSFEPTQLCVYSTMRSFLEYGIDP
ncbi:hypothetical protein BDD12DRAFT_816091 [Trichophaea hybrida]|nr:hypothetical protein BDD12DRAFT_816091 [Trichophaea hybrida]